MDNSNTRRTSIFSYKDLSLATKIINSLFIVSMGVFLFPKIAFMAPITEDNIINLSNIERQKINASTLIKNELLSQAAKQKAEDIAKFQSFSHSIDNKSFSSWIKEANYQYSFIGENLAIDFVDSEEVVEAWLASPTHKENLLNKRFTEIGVSVLNKKINNTNSIIVVQVFGTPSLLPNLNLPSTVSSISKKTIQESNSRDDKKNIINLNNSLSSIKNISKTNIKIPLAVIAAINIILLAIISYILHFSPGEAKEKPKHFFQTKLYHN